MEITFPNDNKLCVDASTQNFMEYFQQEHLVFLRSESPNIAYEQCIIGKHELRTNARTNVSRIRIYIAINGIGNDLYISVTYCPLPI